jgi:hypothetical protein
VRYSGNSSGLKKSRDYTTERCLRNWQNWPVINDVAIEARLITRFEQASNVGLEFHVEGSMETMQADGACVSSRMRDHLFTSEPLALGLARGDEDFRLVVDRASAESPIQVERVPRHMHEVVRGARRERTHFLPADRAAGVSRPITAW